MNEDYNVKRASNYSGFQKLDKMLEKIAEGKLRPPRTVERDFYCPLCHYRKRSTRLVKSEVLGTRLPAVLHSTTNGTPVPSPFDPCMKFILVCGDCGKDLDRSGVR